MENEFHISGWEESATILDFYATKLLFAARRVSSSPLLAFMKNAGLRHSQMFSGPHYVNVWKCETPFYGQSKVWHAFKAALVRLQLHICTLLYKPPPLQTVLFMLCLSVLCCSPSAKYKLLQTIIAQLFSPRWSWMNNSRGTAVTCQWEAVEINFQMLNSNVAGQLHHPHQSAEYSRL